MLVANTALKGVYAIAIAAVLIAALRPLAGQQQAQQTVAAQPQASPVQPAPVQPQPQQPQQQQAGQYYDPTLAAKVQEVKTWSPDAIQAWVQFCYDTAGGSGFSQGDKLVCLAVSQIQREAQ